MTNEQIRGACERSANIANEFEYEDLRAEAFGVILRHLLQDESKNAFVDSGVLQNGVASKAKRLQVQKSAAGSGLKARVQVLISEGFFGEQRSAQDVSSKLRTSGWNHRAKEISARLLDFVRSKQLRRAETKEGNKDVYRYSNW